MSIGITNLNVPYATHDNYAVTFFDDDIYTTVTANVSTVSDWISDILYIHRRRYNRGSVIAGIDVEWRPSFTRNHQNPVATVQICVGRRCLVYQIIHCGGRIPKSLADFLSDDNVIFVGVGVQGDLNKLHRDYGIGNGARSVDLRWLAAEAYDRPELRNAGLSYLAELVLGVVLVKPKRVTMSNWDNRWLGDEQVQYACVDAYVSFDIGRILRAFNY